MSELLVRAASDPAGSAAVEKAAHGITGVYVAAFRLRSSARERDSVTTHLQDLVDVVPAGSETARILIGVHGELKTWTNPDSGVVIEPSGI